MLLNTAAVLRWNFATDLSYRFDHLPRTRQSSNVLVVSIYCQQVTFFVPLVTTYGRTSSDATDAQGAGTMIFSIDNDFQSYNIVVMLVTYSGCPDRTSAHIIIMQFVDQRSSIILLWCVYLKCVYATRFNLLFPTTVRTCFSNYFCTIIVIQCDARWYTLFKNWKAFL